MSLYQDQLATLYKVENGFVVECREKKEPEKAKPKDGCCMPSDWETKTYTAKNAAEVIQIINSQMGVNSEKEYSAAFKDATKKK